MSNRIDLTEFEGMTEGPWLHTIPEHGWDDIVGANGMLVAQVTLENHVDGPSIARLPDLLAELKRCYEEVDYYKCLLNELYSSKQISPSDVLAIEQEVKREFYPELFHHGDGWEKSGGPCECMKCQEEETSE